MKNPYQSPTSPATPEVEAPKFESATQAAAAGARTAIRWVTRIVVPILALVFVGVQIVFVYRGLTIGIWPEYRYPQFWFSMIVLVLALVGAYLVACFWAIVFATILFVAKYLSQSRTKE